MENKVDKGVCDAKNGALEGRMDRIELDILHLDASLEKNLTRIFDKLDKFAGRPSWLVAWAMSGLLSATLSMAIIMMKSGH